MTALTRDLNGVRVLEWAAEGNKLRAARDATGAIGEACSIGAQWLAIPIDRLDDGFFRLRTGLAGEIVSKFVAYRRSVAFVGDLSEHVSGSDAFRDFVPEANRGKDFWLVADLEELRQRIFARTGE